MLRVIMLSVPNDPLMLGVVMLNAIILGVVTLVNYTKKRIKELVFAIKIFNLKYDLKRMS
jgi:hypothetical protein